MRKMLLTSSGIVNPALQEVFEQCLAKPLGEVKVVFIITAALGEAGDKAWLVKDINNLYMAGVAEVDIVDISQPKDVWLPRLEWADVIWAEGGNTKFLMYQIERSGLKDELPTLLDKRLFVGVSAGSMVVGECLPGDVEAQMYSEDAFGEPYSKVATYLGLVPIHVLPHYRSEFIQRSDEDIEAWAKLTEKPIYALDDASAILVEDGDVKRVVGDGAWKIFL